VTAELSEGGNGRRRPDDNPISEMPDDEENASSPPGTIGDRDVMSENIESNFLKFNKGKIFFLIL